MANNLGSLVVSLGLDAGEFTRGMTKAEYQAQQFAKNLERGIEAARVAALGSMAAIGGAVLALDSQLQSIAGFQDLADKIGDTAQEVASLQLAADLSGVSIDNIASASVKLTTALSKLSDEGEGVGKALSAIGLDLESFKQLSPVAQIDAVAKAFSGFEDGASKTAVAVALFGKSGADLIPLFNDLAELGDRQITLTSDQIAAADDYSKAVARLTSEVRTMVSVTAADAAPAMTEMVQILQDVKNYAIGGAGGFNLLSFALETAKVALQTIVVIGSEVAFVLKQTGIEIGGLAAQAAALARLDFKGFSAISDAMKEDSNRARKELENFQKSILLTTDKTADASGKSSGRDIRKPLSFQSDPTKQKVAAGIDKLSAGEKELENLNKQIQALKNLSTEETVLANIQAGRYGIVTDKLKEKLIEQAREIDTSKEFAKIEKEFQEVRLDTARATNKARDANEALVQSMLNATPTAKLEEQRRAMQLLAEAFEQGAISAEQFTEASSTYLGLEKVNEKLKESKTLAEELGLSFSSAFEDAIVNGGGFRDMLKGIEKDIIRILARKSVTEPLANSLKGFDLGGVFGKLFSGFGKSDGGGSAGPLSSFSSFSGGGYTGDGARSGGMDGQGGYLAMLHPQESVIDHAKGQTMGGGTSINQSITIDARGADAGVTERIIQAMKQTKAETLAAVQAQANRGGSFARAVGRA